MRRLPVPNLNAPLVDMVLGRVLRPWNNFFMQFTQDAPKTVYPVPTGSPFEFTSVSGGTFIVSGGTVIAVHLIRGQDAVVMNISVSPIFVPLSIGDTVRVEYSVTPDFRFLGD